MEYIIKPERTAITNGVSLSCKELVENYKEGLVLDYGFGKLRNSKYLLENNIPIHVLDTEVQIKNNKSNLDILNIKKVFKSTDILPCKYYDHILLSFVLNVIPDKNERVQILKNISRSLKGGGLVYIEVRNDTFVKNLKNKISYNDGYITGNGKNKTFQKPYTSTELETNLKECGFNVLKIKKTSGSILAICKKEAVV